MHAHNEGKYANDDSLVCLTGHVSSKTSDGGVQVTEWLIDSRASSHITAIRHLFALLQLFTEDLRKDGVKIGNATPVPIHGVGTLKVELSLNGKKKKFILKNVLFVPDLKFN